jgi:Flp pilus assembly pilin Flp
MFQRIQQLWHEEDGVLSFEWVLLVTLLVLGIVGGLAAARDAVIDELGDIPIGPSGDFPSPRPHPVGR